METPEFIRASLIPGEWVYSIDLLDAYLLISIHPNSRKYLRFCHRCSSFTSLPFGLATGPQVLTVIVKEMKLMALSRVLGHHKYLDDWLIWSQSQEKAQVNTEAVVDLVLEVDNKSGEIRTETYSDVFVRGLRIPSRFSPCINRSREMAQTSGFDTMSQVKHVLTARCLMSLTELLASLEKMVQEGCLHMRPFQFHPKEHWRFRQSLLPWTETISAHLDWWQNPTNMMRGAAFHPKDHSIQLSTDTSNEGWGAYLDQSSTKGL